MKSNNVRTFEEVEAEKEATFKELITKLGGSVMFERAIMFRETPHMHTQWINSVSIEDNFNDFGLAKDTVLQRLRFLLSKKK